MTGDYADVGRNWSHLVGLLIASGAHPIARVHQLRVGRPTDPTPVPLAYRGAPPPSPRTVGLSSQASVSAGACGVGSGVGVAGGVGVGAAVGAAVALGSQPPDGRTASEASGTIATN